jgi:hypothetical protein
LDESADVLERFKVREAAGVFHSRRALDAAVEDLLLNGFDRADIDQLASLDDLYKRFKIYVAPEEAADITSTPRQQIFTRDDITATLVTIVGVIGAAVGVAIVFGVMASGGSGSSAAILGTLVGLAAGTAVGLVVTRVFRRDDLHGLERMEFERGVVLWVRVRSAEREAMAQEILLRNGGRAVRIHEIEVEKRAADLPLSSLRPDPWLGSEPLGHP